MLLERGAELAALDELVDAVQHGTSMLGVVEGTSGLGKSRLVSETRDRAARAGVQVLAASARAIEREFGFGVVGQLFAPAARRNPELLLAGIPEPVAAIIEPHRVEPATVVGAPAFAALHGLYTLTLRLAERQPLLLTVDDLHWCDAASLRYLAYLRTRVDGLPIALLASMRPNENSADPPALHALLGDPATVWLRPHPLSAAAATTLIESTLAHTADPEFAATCHRVTGGNPLLLEQLLSALAAEGVRPDAAHLPMLDEVGPAAVARSVLLRLGRLGNDAVAAARALAVLGDGADLAHVAELANLSVAAAAPAVAALARIDLVHAEPPLSFVHPLVAAAIYRDVPVGEREVRHLRAAELLGATGVPPEQVASHLMRAPARGDPTVVDQLVRAAAVAMAKGAAEGAAAYLERALAEPPTPERRVEVAWALGRAQAIGNGPAAVAHLRWTYDQLDDPEKRGEVAEQLGIVLAMSGAVDESFRVLRGAAEALPHNSDTWRRLTAYDMWAVLFGAGDATALAQLAEYRSAPVAAGSGAKLLAVLAAVHWMYAAGPCDAVSDIALAALADGTLVATDPSWAALALTTLTYADRADAEEWWTRLTTAGHEQATIPEIIAILHNRGEALWRHGELADAEELLRECLTLMAQWGYTEPATTYSHSHLSAILFDRGALSDARRAWSAGRDIGADDPGTRTWVGRGIQLLLAEGSYDRAVAAADAYAERFDAAVPNPMDMPWRSLKALALDRLGRNREARELAEAEMELARAWGAPATVARTLRTLASLESAAAVARLEEAVAAVGGSPARLEHARSLAALGSALLRARRPATARAPLREALAIATGCEAQDLANRARIDLLAAGGRPRRVALRGLEALTPGELRVVRLAADGRTNREVGEELFVTPKTVAMHLSNAYRKLGVKSRRELATALMTATPR